MSAAQEARSEWRAVQLRVVAVAQLWVEDQGYSDQLREAVAAERVAWDAYKDSVENAVPRLEIVS